MPSKEIKEFARKLVQEVRDRAVRASDLKLRPGSNTVTARRWRDAGVTEEAARVVVSDAVDEALFALLNVIEQGIIPLHYVTDDGRVVDLADEGMDELAGWYIGPEGWRHEHSKERFFDFVEP